MTHTIILASSYYNYIMLTMSHSQERRDKSRGMLAQREDAVQATATLMAVKV
jgi:hypothetical protein